MQIITLFTIRAGHDFNALCTRAAFTKASAGDAWAKAEMERLTALAKVNDPTFNDWSFYVETTPLKVDP